MDFLSCFNINVHNIPFPTHNSNHTLDLIITLSDENFVSNFSFNNPVICDHFPVHCNLSIQLPLNPRIAVCYRKLQAIKYGLLTKREVKMTGYWPSSFFACLWTETKSRSINTQKKNEANIQSS